MKRITLEAWASANFSPPPTLPTLRAWARQQRIQPAPVKVGRTWYVEPCAQYDAAGRVSVQALVVCDGLSERAAAILRAA